MRLALFWGFLHDYTGHSMNLDKLNVSTFGYRYWQPSTGDEIAEAWTMLSARRSP